MKRIISLALACLLPAAALAQAPQSPLTIAEPETVTSEAQRQQDRLLSLKFVQSLLLESNGLQGQFSRWKTPTCAHVTGMTPAANLFVERRIRDIARQVGAPVDVHDTCRPNIAVFVTAEPQVTLDALAAKDHMRMLAINAPDRALTMRFPVQAWYVGYYRDYDGIRRIDAPRGVAYAWANDFPPAFIPRGGAPLEGDDRPNPTRLFSGLVPEIGDATVLVDARAIKGMTLGSLADYLTLMTLAQTPATGRCQPAPSIANLFLTDCAADFHATALSAADMAMLNALYQTPDQPENLQKVRLIGAMQRSLEAGR